MTMPVYLIGTLEYVSARVSNSVELSTQPVEIVVGGDTLPAAWEGEAGTTRTCHTLEPVDFTLWPDDIYPLAVKYTDSPEAPLVSAGFIRVKTP
jgi:hypothetical protein